MSISSIGIQTVTATTGTRGHERQPQQQSASNDNNPPVAAKSGTPSPTVGQHVDKRV